MGRLENKHRGGLNNEKGARYEEFYAVYKIASFLADFADQQVLIKSQVEGAYVDDILVVNEGHYSYYPRLCNRGLLLALLRLLLLRKVCYQYNTRSLHTE